MLIQEYTIVIDNKMVSHQHPITYVIGLFQGSHLNWAALTNEVYAICISVKKLLFYLTGASLVLRNEHLSLKGFLQKTA